MKMTGPLLAWMQKLVVQHLILEVQNLFTKVTAFTPIFLLLLVMRTVIHFFEFPQLAINFRHGK